MEITFASTEIVRLVTTLPSFEDSQDKDIIINK